MNYRKFLAIAAMSASVILSNNLFAAENNVIQNDLSVEQSQNINGSNDSEIKYFEVIKKAENSKKAYIVVSGANGTFHVWDQHLESLKKEDVTIIGYEGVGGKGSHPQNIEYMEENAKNIAEGIRSLKSQGYEEINVVAHCLGGVVSKRAVQIVDDANELNGLKQFNFIAVSSPLGGYVGAIPAQFTPFFRPISKFLKIAMSADMSPISDFYESISRPFSSRVNSVIIESSDDLLVQPGAELTKERYEKVANTFNQRIKVESKNEHMFALTPENLEKQGVNLLNYSDKTKQTVIDNMTAIREAALKRDNTDKIILAAK